MEIEGRQVNILERVFGRIILVLLLTAEPSFAAPITVGFEGVIDTVSHATATDPFGSSIGIGTPFKGRYTYDTATPNMGTSAYGVYIHYAPQFGIDVDVGGLFGSASTAQLPLHYRVIIDGLTNDDDVQDIQTQGMSFGGVNAYLAQVFLEGPSSTLPSVDLLTTPPNLQDYFSRKFVLGIGPDPGAADMVYIGSITSMYAIPVPGTLALFALGLAGLGYTRRNR
jgi:hypothetical protein